jgi:hypothetical protein
MMAAQQIVTRDHLAAGDASARAWLRSADSAKKLRQTQLMLIINNLSLSVNSSKDPYESVMQAWISTLKAMESLVQGMPQHVQDGAVLLAISSWHLYPDMEVLVEQVKRVDQKDDLMHGGLITLSKPARSPSKEGVFWSLPLSRMRYYHPPQTTERRVASETSQVTMDEFWLIILGAMVGAWAEGETGIVSACKFLLIVEPHIMCLENDTCGSRSCAEPHHAIWMLRAWRSTKRPSCSILEFAGVTAFYHLIFLRFNSGFASLTYLP